jgi:hypothetical protein
MIDVDGLGVAWSRRCLHLSHHRLTPEGLVLDPPAFRGFLLEIGMALYLPSELQTEVYGVDGMICIKQTCDDEHNPSREVCLTVHQFMEIFNRERHLVREALGTE